MSSDRRGQAQSSLRNVKERHEAIQKIDRQIMELAQQFNDLNQIVVQQEPLIQNIDQEGEEVHEYVVKERNDAIQKHKRLMMELAQLFQDLDQIVMQQEPLVQNIEQKGEEVHDNVVQANTEISGAIEKARSRNRKKWWCLLICSKWNVPVVRCIQILTLHSHHSHHCCHCGRSCCHQQPEKERQTLDQNLDPYNPILAGRLSVQP